MLIYLYDFYHDPQFYPWNCINLFSKMFSETYFIFNVQIDRRNRVWSFIAGPFFLETQKLPLNCSECFCKEDIV